MDGIDSHDLAWTAGIVDADGTIRIEGHTGLIYVPRVVVYQKKYPSIIYRLQELYGGNVHVGKRNGLLTWRVTSKCASDLIAEIVPYLIAKKGQAELCIELRRSIDLGKQRFFGSSLPIEMWEHRRALFEACKVLNKGEAPKDGIPG